MQPHNNGSFHTNLEGQAAIVTGGARGIGRAIVQLLAEAKAEILIADIREEEARATAAQLVAETGSRIEAIRTDVSNLADVETMRDYALKQFGKIDILVNNAGWDRITPFLKTTPDFWDRIIAINFKGVLNTCYSIIPAMVQRKQGCIVNVASDAARVGSFGEAVYGGAKAAVVAFSKTNAREHARDNIRVNVVCPGLAETGLVEEMNQDEFARKILGSIVNHIPLRRFGQPEEIAPMVLFLASNASRYITGQVVSVDGGLTMV